MLAFVLLRRSTWSGQPSVVGGSSSVVDWRLPIVGCRLSVADRRFSIVVRRWSVVDCRNWAAPKGRQLIAMGVSPWTIDPLNQSPEGAEEDIMRILRKAFGVS